MQLALFIIIEYILCIITCLFLRADTPLSLLVFISPVYLSFSSFLLLKKIRSELKYNEKVTAVYTGISFYLILLIVSIFYQLTGLHINNRLLFLAIPGILSFLPFFIINNWSLQHILLFISLSFLLSWLMIKYDWSPGLFFSAGSISFNGVAEVFDFLTASFITNSLLMMIAFKARR